MQSSATWLYYSTLKVVRTWPLSYIKIIHAALWQLALLTKCSVKPVIELNLASCMSTVMHYIAHSMRRFRVVLAWLGSMHWHHLTSISILAMIKPSQLICQYGPSPATSFTRLETVLCINTYNYIDTVLFKSNQELACPRFTNYRL